MAKQKTKEELQVHCKNALAAIENLLNSYINSENPSIRAKADKLSYWLEDYSKYLQKEATFTPTKLKKYKRGEVIKVDLGYNVGSEEGGLHYCIVLDKNNSIHNPVITVIPLTSVKPTTNLEKLHSGSIYLGNSLYTTMFAKLNSLQKVYAEEFDKTMERIKSLEALLKGFLNKLESDESFEYPAETVEAELTKIQEEHSNIATKKALIDKVLKEISKMKQGSIALVSQITTVSKMRIYDPRTSRDVLAGIRLSNENLDSIDEEIKKLYLK